MLCTHKTASSASLVIQKFVPTLLTHISPNSRPFLVGIVSLGHILATTLASRRVSTKAWHKLLGELRSMVLGIPGGHGLFSQLQLVLRSCEHHRVRIHHEACDQLLDLQLLADDLTARPTRIAKVVPGAPHYVSCSDVALSGMCGVWFPPPGGHGYPPYVWREPFPPHIQASLVSDRNPVAPSPIPTWNSPPPTVT